MLPCVFRFRLNLIPFLASAIGLLLVLPSLGGAQTVSVGAGSYTTALPAGAATPPSLVYKTHSGPPATHKFWTAKYFVPQGNTRSGGSYFMFPDPLSIAVLPSGLRIGYFNTVMNNGTWFNQPYQPDLTIGSAGLNAGVIKVSAVSDWTADFNFGPITTRVGRGMPFVYVLTNGTKPTITFTGTPTFFSNNGNFLGVSIAGNNYGLFGPAGSTWSGIGGLTLTCNLPAGHNYLSVALLPNAGALTDYYNYAFSFPTNTAVSWNYNSTTSTVNTTYTVTTQAMEGTQTGFLSALYPHHYGSLPGGANTSYTYVSPRGTMKVHRAASFTTSDLYHGVIPFHPPEGAYNRTTLQGYLDTVAAEGNHFTANETYGAGKQFARIAQLLPIARAQATPAATNDFNQYLSTLKAAMQGWLTAGAGEAQNLFYYNSAWGSLTGYPASFGSDTSLNDHHFHYGYWIHAAALIGLFDPSWTAPNQWGGMVNLLARDIAQPTRGDNMFPFLRHFDVYAGHSWASGEAPFGDGGNEESSSEAVNAWTGLIIYATQTGDTQLRDAAIWLYTMETNAVMYYWFNSGPVSTFPAGFNRQQIANLFDAKSDTGTWFGLQTEFEHGIEYLPLTGGSNYLGRDPAYVQRAFGEIVSQLGGSFNPQTALWPDLLEEFQAFSDPNAAIANFNNTTAVFDGETKAHELYFLYNLQKMGRVDYTVTANTPLYAVYRNPSNGLRTHVAYNASSTPSSVTFSDGVTLNVPAMTLKTENTSVTTSGNGGTLPPAAPSHLTATTASSSQIDLAWTASTTSGVTYTIYRSTTNGFTPAAANQIASGLTNLSLSNTGLATATTYYYKVAAVSSAGVSPASNQASATTSGGGGNGGPISINSGGGTAGTFVADIAVSGGSTASTAATIDTSLVPAPVPPQGVFQTERYGTFTYTLPGLTAGRNYTVALYFAETYWDAAGKRRFNVAINGNRVLTDYDVFANTGGKNRGKVEFFSAPANASGQIVISFTTGSADLAKLSGLSVF